MLKTLAKQIREFKKDSILTPVFMILEVILETLIPLLMGSIIDKGVVRELQRALQKISVRQCTVRFRPFPLQTLTSFLQQDWSPE